MATPAIGPTTAPAIQALLELLDPVVGPSVTGDAVDEAVAEVGVVDEIDAVAVIAEVSVAEISRRIEYLCNF
jgi:hypothetical protein